LQAQSLFRCKPYQLSYPAKYHGESIKSKVQKIETLSDGRQVTHYQNMTELVMPDGSSRREQHSDGYTCVYFANGDVRQVYPEGTDLVEQRSSVYFYKEASIT